MPYNPAQHDRRSIRLKGYDYTTPGAYFLTLCTHQRQSLFGDIVDGEMQLNDWGKIVEMVWLDIPTHHPQVELDQFVVMPNHIHGILVITANGRGEALMPNHVHGTLSITANGRGEAFAPGLSANGRDVDANASPLQPRDTQPGSIAPGLSANGRDVDANASPLQPRGTQPGSIGAMVQTFKSNTTRRINRISQASGRTLWQRNYYEHIIRNEDALQRIRTYIQMNPRSWLSDQLHPTQIA